MFCGDFFQLPPVNPGEQRECIGCGKFDTSHIEINTALVFDPG